MLKTGLLDDFSALAAGTTMGRECDVRLRWAIVTLALVAALAWLALSVPLSNALPGGRTTGENLLRLESALTADRDPDWQFTRQLLSRTQQSWTRLEPWLEFLHEKDTVNSFRTALARLAGAIESRDADMARQEIQELKVLWEDLNRL